MSKFRDFVISLVMLDVLLLLLSAPNPEASTKDGLNNIIAILTITSLSCLLPLVFLTFMGAVLDAATPEGQSNEKV